VCFEHGALTCTGSGCGIYHAHLHLVPLPQRVKPASIFPEFTGRSQNMNDTLRQFINCEEYLFFGSGEELVYAPVGELQFRPQSQFFRKRLADHFGLTKSWDWRHYTAMEPYMVETIEYFRQIQTGNRL
jgi:hypothetical protein